MPQTKILARNLKCELNTGTDALPTWTPVGGLNSVTIKYDKTNTETTDFDSAGWAEHLVAQRGTSITLEGFYKEDTATAARDAGQAALIALADAIGPASLKPFRITTPGGNKTVYQVSARVDAPAGGGLNDTAKFAADLDVSGKPAFTPGP